MIFPLILRDAVFQNKLTPSHHSKASQKRHRKGSVASDISSSSNDRWSPSDRKKLKRSTLRDESSDSDEILITEDRTPLKSPRENTSLSNGFGDKSIESGINIDLPTKEQNLWFVCEVIRESINELLNAMLRTFWRVEWVFFVRWCEILELGEWNIPNETILSTARKMTFIVCFMFIWHQNSTTGMKRFISLVLEMISYRPYIIGIQNSMRAKNVHILGEWASLVKRVLKQLSAAVLEGIELYHAWKANFCFSCAVW